MRTKNSWRSESEEEEEEEEDEGVVEVDVGGVEDDDDVIDDVIDDEDDDVCGMIDAGEATVANETDDDQTRTTNSQI
jgi:hypothetical protein